MVHDFFLQEKGKDSKFQHLLKIPLKSNHTNRLHKSKSLSPTIVGQLIKPHITMMIATFI